MSARLLLDSVVVGGGPVVRVAVPAGGRVVVRHPAPERLVRCVAGTEDGAGGLLLDGVEVAGLAPNERVAAGLGTATCRLPALPAMRVLDVVLLASPVGGPSRSWRAALGLGVSADLRDQEAAARAHAGRIGLGRWTTSRITGIPAAVEALTDLARALAGSPAALVWRLPEWLGPGDIRAAREVVADHQERLGFAVVEVSATS